MFQDYDDSFSDFEVLSSPSLTERDFSITDYSFSSQGLDDSFELSITGSNDTEYPSSQPEPYYMSDFKQIITDVKQPISEPGFIRPKKKVSSVVFTPFSSFEATEITVRSLMGVLGA